MFNFKDLFVFDMANNHQGDLDHANEIVKQISKISNTKSIKGAIKLQFRNLDEFIHKQEINNNSNPNIKRFLSTKLEWDQFSNIQKNIKKYNLLSMCTPFDEFSVDKIKDMNFDLIKVASCSADDWPLLEKVAQSGLPVVVSTGGLMIDEIDNLVSFFSHKGVDFAIMHCISIYPTSPNQAQIGFINTLKNRFPNVEIGWSTHEDPDDQDIIKVAYACGARMFERHVGISNEKYNLNAYSSNPDQISKWIDSFNKSREIIGGTKKVISEQEISALKKLKRGVYAKNRIKENSFLLKENIYFAIPYLDGQLMSGDWNEHIKTKVVVEKDKMIKFLEINEKVPNKNFHIKKTVHKVKAILNEAKIHLNPEFTVEFSHHYGIDQFLKTGATIINCINREYCKKILVQTPGQNHPAHFHKRKEETFHLLSGDLEIWVDGIQRMLSPGDTCLVMPGVWHSFNSKNGCVIEEVSTTHFKNDSVYKDPIINDAELESRKTIVPNWGRYFI